ncbi:hypothetical protein [Fulvivirga lutea]|uniref:Uncharacterized protein n=1 Tax=Fulvivirga lutea TaxID=2810512 RepID=A0A974WJF0_9BACT|nr:hypothetical protein [Fulvivirga lutea]QSE99049.1 hypothetical protein JR347_08175 [Fulvivirga lutea]
MENTKSLFTEKQVSVAAFLGGPIPPSILIYKNLVRLDKIKEAYIVLAATLIFTLGLLYTLIAIPDDVYNNIPSQLIPTIVGLIVWVLYHFLLSHYVKDSLEAGSATESNWKVAGFTVLGIVIYLFMAFIVGISQPPFPGEKMVFNRNEIYYNDRTSKEDVQKVADVLYEFEYFSDGYQSIAKLETWPYGYELTLPIIQDYWNDPAVVNDIQILKELLKERLQKDVTIILEDYKLNGDTIVKRF